MTEKTVMIRGKARRVRVMPNGMYRFLKGGGKRTVRRVKRRVKSTARRRRYGRRRGGRRSYGRRFTRHFRGMGIPSIAGFGLSMYVAQKFGLFDAASQLMGGNITGAAATIANRASNVNTYIGPVCGGLALKGIRSMAGPLVLAKFGKRQLRLW